MSDSVDYSTKRLFHTGICKTDCLLLELEHDVFDILIRQQIRRKNEFLAAHTIKTFPKLTKYYTPLRVSEHAPEFVKEDSFKKNEYI